MIPVVEESFNLFLRESDASIDRNVQKLNLAQVLVTIEITPREDPVEVSDRQLALQSICC